MKLPHSLGIFLTFFRIGMFTLGGGYAMLPLIRREVVDKHAWLDDDTFVDGLAASQSCPGPIAVNMSIYTGYHILGWRGVALAVAGTVLPSFFVILLIAWSFTSWADYPMVRKAFHGLRPCVTALIAEPVFTLSKRAGIPWYKYWIPALAMVLIIWGQLSPLYLILFTILMGWWLNLYRQRKEARQ